MIWNIRMDECQKGDMQFAFLAFSYIQRSDANEIGVSFPAFCEKSCVFFAFALYLFLVKRYDKRKRQLDVPWIYSTTNGENHHVKRIQKTET